MNNGYMTDGEYQFFKMLVLSKTCGRSIHDVNNLLGLVVNYNDLGRYSKDPKESEEFLREVMDAKKRIGMTLAKQRVKEPRKR